MVAPPPDVGNRAAAAAATPSRPSATGTERSTAPPEAPVAIDRADIRPLDLAGALQILIAEVRASLVETLVADLQPADAGATPARPLDIPVPGTPAAVSPTSIAEIRTSLLETLVTDLQLPATPVRITATPEPATAGNAELLAVAAAQDVDGPVPAARVVVDLALRSLPATFELESWSLALPRMDQALQAGVQRAVDAVSVWRDVPLAIVDATKESGNLALALLADEPVYPWPPPEWLGMAPRLALLWRRRRALKRRLVDPDSGADEHGDPAEDRRR